MVLVEYVEMHIEIDFEITNRDILRKQPVNIYRPISIIY